MHKEVLMLRQKISCKISCNAVSKRQNKMTWEMQQKILFSQGVDKVSNKGFVRIKHKKVIPYEQKPWCSAHCGK